LKNCQTLSVFQSKFTSNSLRARSSEKIIPDPAKSFGSVRIRIRNTVFTVLTHSCIYFSHSPTRRGYLVVIEKSKVTKLTSILNMFTINRYVCICFLSEYTSKVQESIILIIISRIVTRYLTLYRSMQKCKFSWDDSLTHSALSNQC
jgi:hypothetical protein